IHQIEVPSAVKGQLWDAGLRGRVSKKKPHLKLENKKKGHGTVDDRKRVLQTDECKFQVFGSLKRTYVRHRANERMLEEYLMFFVEHVRGYVMIWGFLGAGKHHVVPYGQQLTDTNFILQQDNDANHSSKK
ncbi:hypothetical protein Z043_106285, partial [Scleropages formosus]